MQKIGCISLKNVFLIQWDKNNKIYVYKTHFDDNQKRVAVSSGKIFFVSSEVEN
jgi:hypothetical protein